ncbi:MAG TPA: serine/threonine-protein kinase [Vicinamibacterales bacterium]
MTQTIAHYNLIERIGEGALGEVYRARDTKFGRTVALKVIRAGAIEGDAREALLDDARTAATLSHPNIATLFDVGEFDEGCYLAYEFAPGTTLMQEIAGRPVNPRRVVELSVQIADALAEGHSRGIMHTDIRPDTIFVTPKGNAKVIEFGMARWTRGGAHRRRAAANPDSLGAEAESVVAYMSPEQALGGLVDARSDVFSLGVIVYEMLAGKNPFTGARPAETLVNVIAGHPAPASATNQDVPPEFDALIARALAKDIEHRLQSAASFSAELRSIGAMLDVRTGDSPSPGELLPIDDDPGTARWWLVVAAGLAIGAAAWWFLAR